HIVDAHCRQAVYVDVLRTDDRRPDAVVRARDAAVRIDLDFRKIANSALPRHQVNPPGDMMPTPPKTGPSGTYGGAYVGTGPVPITFVTNVVVCHMRKHLSNPSQIASNSCE